MGKIVLLDYDTINKIAAGEVIDRPASAVKEIMENSIDAGATQITVEIRNGGISYIRVTDNGKGIMQDDMEIAFERHATSKLRNAEELQDVTTMGFRGEALASIAAIAKVTLISKTEDENNGYKIAIEGGKILEKQEEACQNGTIITIENLFYNTPVRYKFLKKDFTESGYIEDAVTRIALVHPEIAIKLINSGKTVIQTPGNGNTKSVIYNIYGKEIAENIINIDYQYEDIHIKGVIGKPEISRSNRTNQLFYINKRFIKDKTLLSAAEQAFKDVITFGRHGFLVLNIEMNPKKVDVNVHPAKLEVRFQDENQMFKAVYHAIKEGLKNETPQSHTVENIQPNFVNKENYNSYLNNTNKAEETPQEPSISAPKTGSESFKNMEKQNESTFESILEKIKKLNESHRILKEKENAEVSQNTENVENKPEIIQTENKIEPTVQIENKIETKELKDNKIYQTQSTDKIEDINSAEPINAIENKNSVEETKNTNTAELINKIENTNLAQNAVENIKTAESNEAKKEKSDSRFLAMYERNFGLAVKKPEKEEKNNISDELKPATNNTTKNISLFENTSQYSNKPVYKYIGMAFDSYIVIEMNESLYIINQQEANAKVIYRKLQEEYYLDEGEKNSQLMLLPDIITLDHKKMGVYRDNVEMLKRAGFMAEEFGENTVKLSGVPEILIELETKDIFMDVLEAINTVARTDKKAIEEKLLQTVARSVSKQEVKKLETPEVIKLLDTLLMQTNPFAGIDGNIIAMKMTKYDIEKKFSRIQ